MDVTEALTSWLDGVPDDAIAVLAEAACYRIDGTLRIDDHRGLTIKGRGATLRAFTPGDDDRRHHVVVNRGGGITIRNLTVIGANPNAGMSDEAWDPSHIEHGFKLNGVDGALLSNVRVYDVYGDFVYVGGADNVPSSNVQILNSTFDRNGRQGIAVVFADHVLIQGNTVANVRQATIDIEPLADRWAVQDVQVIGNTLGPWRPGFTMLSAASQGWVSDVYFADNSLIGTMRAIVEARDPDIRYSGFTFVRNTATEPANTGFAIFRFEKVDAVLIDANTIPFEDGTGTDLVGLTNTCHVGVTNNDLSGVDDIFVVHDEESCDYHEENNVT